MPGIGILRVQLKINSEMPEVGGIIEQTFGDGTIWRREDAVNLDGLAGEESVRQQSGGGGDDAAQGGLPGFVRIVDERTLAFPDYNGNGMYRSLGNVLVNQSVALLFIDFERPQRLRVLGQASLHHTDPLLAEFPGAQLIVRVRATRIFPNCPRYVHEMRLVKHSVYVPRQHHTPPVPVWKQWEEFRGVLPRSEPIPPRSLRTYLRLLEQRSRLFRIFLRVARRARESLDRK